MTLLHYNLHNHDCLSPHWPTYATVPFVVRAAQHAASSERESNRQVHVTFTLAAGNDELASCAKFGVQSQLKDLRYEKSRISQFLIGNYIS